MPELIDRIHTCLAKFAPAGGRYVVHTRDDKTLRLELIDSDGDTLGGTGATLDAALTALEAKLHDR